MQNEIRLASSLQSCNTTRAVSTTRYLTSFFSVLIFFFSFLQLFAPRMKGPTIVGVDETGFVGVFSYAMAQQRAAREVVCNYFILRCDDTNYF